MSDMSDSSMQHRLENSVGFFLKLVRARLGRYVA